jgi:RHS repeat-associated protein
VDSSLVGDTTVAAGRSVAYGYDFLGRLSTASTTGSGKYPAWGISETYDQYGNRSAQTVTAGSAPQPSFAINSANNRISSTGYQYDAAGHMVVEPWPFNGAYSYDGEECLTSFTGNGGTATYTCDGNHSRVQKVVTGSNAVSTVYIYSGGHVIAEYDNGAAVTSPTREYVYAANNLLGMVTGSTSGSGGTTTYIYRDHLSPRLYVNDGPNVVGEQGTYPFGEPWYSNNTTSNWVFTSYERDAESGNDNALARSYNSSEGRFMSPDPVRGNPANPRSWNRYAYALNDPINGSDPSGKCDATDPTDCPVDPPTGDDPTTGWNVTGNPAGQPYSISNMTWSAGDITGTGTWDCNVSTCAFFPDASLSGQLGTTAPSFDGVSPAQQGGALEGMLAENANIMQNQKNWYLILGSTYIAAPVLGSFIGGAEESGFDFGFLEPTANFMAGRTTADLGPYVFRNCSPMTPEEVFDSGFSPAGTDMDLFAHTLGRPNSGYVATSASYGYASMATDIVAVIPTPANAIDVNAALAAQGIPSKFSLEFEMAVPGSIPGSQVRAVTMPNQGVSLLNPGFKP